ncbi:uncharacterized protein LOC113005515 isoform X2 [Solenopsis invicta]|uniref:uncharacterized protein LOC113005515 isoform X2 n=1 Tax=Solenopsis invicta TaxID=13686 RepID=UPI00193CB93F|nr:uncharacterized protein LOC113005515 isoform X2 [Solenopsis invicta]
MLYYYIIILLNKIYVMERVIVGGFMCAMSDCNNNSGADRHLSFFRFPSNSERAKVWPQACGIKKNIPEKKLYNNYRVCSKHFAPHMFLNNLKNRLQPYAVPISAVPNISNEAVNATESEINVETSIENCTEDIQVNVPEVKISYSRANLTDAISNAIDFNSSNSVLQCKEDKATETEPKLSNRTPRKETLRRKCDTAEKRLKRAKLKYNKEKNLDDITYSDFQKLLYKFYPKPIADFMKVQGDNFNNKKNGNYPAKIFSA